MEVEIIKKQVIVLNRLNFRWLSQIKNALTNDDSKLASEAGKDLQATLQKKRKLIKLKRITKTICKIADQKQQHAVLISENGGKLIARGKILSIECGDA
jgi:hypothetical protein